MWTGPCDFSYAPYVKYHSPGSHHTVFLSRPNLSHITLFSCHGQTCLTSHCFPVTAKPVSRSHCFPVTAKPVSHHTVFPSWPNLSHITLLSCHTQTCLTSHCFPVTAKPVSHHTVFLSWPNLSHITLFSCHSQTCLTFTLFSCHGKTCLRHQSLSHQSYGLLISFLCIPDMRAF